VRPQTVPLQNGKLIIDLPAASAAMVEVVRA
jgi:hypothetical protein